MKKFYMSLALAMLAGSLSAQWVAPERTGAKELRTGEGEFRAKPSPKSNNARAAAIFAENFSTGVPAGWRVYTPGNPGVVWHHTTTGPGSSSGISLASTTASNGWMIVDSDDDANSSSPPENTKLISKAIIPSSAFPAKVKLEFQQMYREWSNDTTIVAVSADSIVWTEYIVNSNVDGYGTANPDQVVLDVSSVIGGEDTCWIRFDWRGQWDYGWQIDDVKIDVLPDHDVQINYPFYADDSEYTRIPLSQVRPHDFNAIAKNVGAIDHAVSLDVDVTGPSGPAWSGASIADSVHNGEYDTLWTTGTFSPTEIGTHTASFSLDIDSTDVDLSNNTFQKSWLVTDGEYAVDDGIVASGLWGGGTVGLFEPFFWGVKYRLPNDEVISSITFFVHETTYPGAFVSVLLYDAATFSTLYARNDYEIKLEDLDTWVTVTLRDGLNAKWEYDASADSYIAGVKFNGGSDAFILGSTANISRSQTTYEFDYSDTTWYTSNTTPMIRLNVGHDPVAGIEEETDMEETFFALGQNYPNPAAGITTITYELDKASAVDFEVIDMTGNTVHKRNEGLKNAGKHKLSIDASAFSPGIYFYSIGTESGRKQKRMIVSH